MVEQDIVGPTRRLRGHIANYAKIILMHKRPLRYLPYAYSRTLEAHDN
jgi:hypothetical protein